MKKYIVCGLLILSLICGSAMAERVAFSNEVMLPCVKAAGETPESLAVKQLDVLGRVAEDLYLIVADGEVRYADAESLNAVLEGSVTLSALEDLTEQTGIEVGSSGEEVRQLQVALTELGYLSGTADGIFGNKSMAAVKAFQEACYPAGLGADVVDLATLRLALALTDSSEAAITLEGVEVTAEVKYAEIIGKVESDLSAFSGREYRLEYDRIDETGRIVLNQALKWQSENVPDIDAMAFTVSLALELQKNESGQLTAVPVMKLTAESARRLYMRRVVLKAGETRYEAMIETTECEIQGRYVSETAWLAIDEAFLEALDTFAEQGTADMRIEGKYRTFDISVNADEIPALKEFVTGVQTL